MGDGTAADRILATLDTEMGLATLLGAAALELDMGLVALQTPGECNCGDEGKSGVLGVKQYFDIGDLGVMGFKTMGENNPFT
mmetsp:Transcript_43862/g.78729  ORF Transcript_43862/g.78729 Transcript_43862/m.78729 type:complete len:82 (+) Transcript_43862:1726-1971(+)